MRHILFTFFVIVFNLLFSVVLKSNITLPSEDRDFFALLAKESGNITSLNSTFTQIKYIKLVDKKLISEGNFFYQKGGKIRFDYTKPKKMSIIMNQNKLQILADDKKTTYDFKSQKSLAELAIVMEACISGKIDKLPNNYKAEYIKQNSAHIIKINRIDSGTNNPYSTIELQLNLSNYSLEKLTLFEKSDNYTVYVFSNMAVNQTQKQILFII